jgi:hypothetical protein
MHDWELTHQILSLIAEEYHLHSLPFSNQQTRKITGFPVQVPLAAVRKTTMTKSRAIHVIMQIMRANCTHTQQMSLIG